MTDDVLFLSGDRVTRTARRCRPRSGPRHPDPGPCPRDRPGPRPDTRTTPWSPHPGHRTRVAATPAAEPPFPAETVVTARQAVTGASPFVTRTVAGAGRFDPTRRGLGPEAVRRPAAVVGDGPETAAGHAGPVVDDLRDAAPAPDHPIPLGAVLTGRRSTRTGPDGIVHHNSVGRGIQDAAAAWAVVGAAQKERP